MAVKCRCIHKFRDKQGRIIGYRLRDENEECIDLSPDNLKIAIMSNELNIANLQLTSDNRLIHKKEKTILSDLIVYTTSKLEEIKNRYNMQDVYKVRHEYLGEDKYIYLAPLNAKKQIKRGYVPVCIKLTYLDYLGLIQVVVFEGRLVKSQNQYFIDSSKSINHIRHANDILELQVFEEFIQSEIEKVLSNLDAQ